MSTEYKRSVDLFWMAKKTTDVNTRFNVDSERVSIQESYLNCLRLLAAYARARDDPVVACAIWGGRKKLGVKFQGRKLTVGVVTAGDIKVGITHELKSPFEIKKYLVNAMRFTLGNQNEELFEKAYKQLKKIETEKNILIEPEETKKWSN
jgi:hypothetical protein